jgi:hypothetical protein
MDHGEAYRAMCSVAYDRVKFGIATAKNTQSAIEQMTTVEMAGHLLHNLGAPKIVIRFLLIVGQGYDRWQPDLSTLIEKCCDDTCSTCHGSGVVKDDAAPIGWRSCLCYNE